MQAISIELQTMLDYYCHQVTTNGWELNGKKLRDIQKPIKHIVLRANLLSTSATQQPIIHHQTCLLTSTTAVNNL